MCISSLVFLFFFYIFFYFFLKFDFVFFFFFFFQAEDGIRDHCVTGVQTCALPISHRRRLATHLDAMLALCETVQCRRVQLLNYFGQEAQPCGNCDTCLTPPQTWDGTVPAQKVLSTIRSEERRVGEESASEVGGDRS